MHREILSQLIKKHALIELETEQSKKPRVTLKEPSAKYSFVIISNMPDDALVIKADEFESPSSIFNGKHGECKRADYVIISEEYLLQMAKLRPYDPPLLLFS